MFLYSKIGFGFQTGLIAKKFWWAPREMLSPTAAPTYIVNTVHATSSMFARIVNSIVTLPDPDNRGDEYAVKIRLGR